MMDRIKWGLFEFLRQMTILVATVLFTGVILAVTEMSPWIVVLLLAAVAVRSVRRWRVATARVTAGPVASGESTDAEDSTMPAWLDDARCYYSEIRADSTDPVNVFARPRTPR